MEEIEVPLEQSQEHIMEHATEHSETHHGGSGHGHGVSWLNKLALSSAILAVLAAVAALFAGAHANEAMIEQMHASDNWNFYQAKGIKSAIISSRSEILQGLGKSIDPADKEKIEKYKADQEQIKEQADEETQASAEHMRVHEIFARAVTMFQVAIAISAIAILTKKKRFWFVSLIFGGLGLIFFTQALLQHGSHSAKAEPEKKVVASPLENGTLIETAAK